jgi:hypothetical protein
MSEGLYSHREKERKQYVVKHTDYEAPRYVHFPQASWLPLRAKCSPQHPVVGRPQFMLFAYRETIMLLPYTAKQTQLLL